MAFDDDGVVRRISGRLKIALVADLVKRAATAEAANRVLLEPNIYPYDWTGHLARQLGLPGVRFAGVDHHDTLLMLVGHLDDGLRDLASLAEEGSASSIVGLSLAHISTQEALALLYTGPEGWLHGEIPACKVENLAKHLRPVLQRGLTSSVGGMLRRWHQWDVAALRDQCEDAVRQEHQRLAARRSAAGNPRKAGPKRPKPIPAPPPLSEVQAAEAERIRRLKGKTLPHYEPPWESER